MDKGDGDGVQWDGVAIEVENSEANLHHVKWLFWRRRERHHFDGIAQRDGLGFFAILYVTLNSRDRRWRGRGEDLVVIRQKKTIIDSEFQRLVPLVFRIRLNLDLIYNLPVRFRHHS